MTPTRRWWSTSTVKLTTKQILTQADRAKLDITKTDNVYVGVSSRLIKHYDMKTFRRKDTYALRYEDVWKKEDLSTML
jgi:hypothetical protein